MVPQSLLPSRGMIPWVPRALCHLNPRGLGFGFCFHFCFCGFCSLSLSFFFFFLFLVKATPMASGSSQARDWIRTAAAGHSHSHSNWDPSHVCDLYHRSRQRQILNPLSEARDQTCILMDTSWISYHWATTGTTCIFFWYRPRSLQVFSISNSYSLYLRWNMMNYIC